MNDESGVYSLTGLRAAGLSTTQIRTLVRSGELHPVRYGWVRTDRADSAALAAVTAGGALSCVSALRFHQAHGLGKLWLPPGYPDTHVRLTRHGLTTPRPSGFQWCRGYGGRPTIVAGVDSVPVALGAAARCMTAEHWVACVDSVLNSTAMTIADIQADMGAVPMRIRELLRRCDGRAQSGTESIVRLRLVALGFTVVVQPAILAFEHADLRVGSLLLECDGRKYHTSGPARGNDYRRDRKTLVDGWMTMRVTYADVIYDWESVLADIRAVTRPRRHRVR